MQMTLLEIPCFFHKVHNCYYMRDGHSAKSGSEQNPNKRVKQHFGQVQLIEYDSIGFLVPENVGFDTKIKTICQLEAKQLRK